MVPWSINCGSRVPCRGGLAARRLETRCFSWGVWVSLSRDSFSRAADLWDTPGREAEKPYLGWLTTDLPVYPTTLNPGR